MPSAPKGHPNSTHRRPKKLARWGKYLNSPLAVTLFGGILVLLISTFIQDRYWRSQQNYLLGQSRHSHKIEAASATEEEVIRAIGERLTGTTVLIAAHEDHYPKGQYEEKLRAYEKSLDDWENAQDVLNLKVNIYFDPKINNAWADLRNEFDALDTTVMHQLEQRDTQSTKPEHLKATEQARKESEKIIGDLNGLATDMNHYIEEQSIVK